MEYTLKNVKVLFLDADGVFFDGSETRTVILPNRAVISKRRSYVDSQGLSFIRGLDITILFVSGEGQPLDSVIRKLNSLPSVKSGAWKPIQLFTKKNAPGAKLETIKRWLSENNVGPGQCAYMGDDINDFEPMTYLKERGAMIIAPHNATRMIRGIAHIITKASGGKGAIRELTEMILDANGVDETTLPIA